MFDLLAWLYKMNTGNESGGGGGGGGNDFSPHSADGCYFENANSLKAYATNNK